MKLVRYTGESDWSALYVDGKLHKVGDHYLIDEAIQVLVGVEEHQSEDFMKGGNDYSDVAKTLDELNAWVAKRDSNAADASREEKLAKAAELIAEAEKLRQEAQ
jgi:hypothetical protein